MISILPLVLGLSVVLNIILAFFLIRFKRNLPKKQPDANAQEVMAELMAGPAVFRIEIVDKGSILQWRQ